MSLMRECAHVHIGTEGCCQDPYPNTVQDSEATGASAPALAAGCG
jgi:hypothetical protein